MLAVYALTLAPDVTFWDAGEFIAAAHSLGIPHPPGTPLFVMLLHVWALVLGRVLPYAVATNLFSAVGTAAAAGLAAFLVARGSAAVPRGAAFAGALCAGAMSTVWMNATETEVYAAALLLAMATLVAAQSAARETGTRWLALTAYLIALAVPLHLSALVAGPAAVVIAAQRDEGVDLGRGLLLGGAWLLATGVGRMSPPILAAGIAVVMAGGALLRRRAGVRPAAAAAGVVAASALGFSAVLFLLVRARFDPFLNQGNPSTWAALFDVIARRQYDVAPLWPRQAPVWLQLANVGQYADWQAALGLGATVLPSVGRTLGTMAFLGLGVLGSSAHRRDDRRTWRALLVLLVCGTLGVAAYVNFKAGPSLGAGVLPASALHEARERDYFYFLGFWAWGLWAGYGAVALARRFGFRTPTGAALAALPVLLNWRAVTREHRPEALLARRWGTELLQAAPPNGVLFAAGDNDTYPLWYAQEVLGVRRDVRVVTLPLMPAGWYRAELHRRGDLMPASQAGVWTGADASEAAVVSGRARAQGRPVAVSVDVDAPTRRLLGRSWTTNGLTFVLDSAGVPGPAGEHVVVDSSAAAHFANEAADVMGGTRPSIDPADAYFQGLLGCPAYLLQRMRGQAAASLDSLCNLR
jgi:Protein O-mannosyl-transferase TMEM260-like